MKLIEKPKSDHVLALVRRAIPLCLVLPLLGALVSYVAYADELAVSEWPWRIGVLVALACNVALLFIHVRYRGTNELFAYGLVMSISLFATYSFFGIFSYFVFFTFAPMPALARWPGLIGGVALNIYWAVIVCRSVRHTINFTSFLGKALDDQGEVIVYDVQLGAKEFERRHKEPSIMPKFGEQIIFGLAPFYLILNRVLSSTFGTNGVLLFLAVLGMPMALFLVSVLVRIFLLMIALQKRIEKERGKRVLVVE